MANTSSHCTGRDGYADAVSEVLLIAAGGGGDVIGAVMVAETLGFSPREAIIATVAWERLLVDPVPGPRSADDFDGLRRRGSTYEILPTTRARHPFGSLLPSLRRDLEFPLFLLDPEFGTLGLVDQLGELRDTLTGRRDVLLLDVGGDVLATGSEPGLRSPLCDALTLAATAQLSGEPRVLVAGPGLDGELTHTEINARLQHARAQVLTTLSPPSRRVRDVLSWHPTEANALMAASAMGIRGLVEIRDAGTSIELTPQSAQVWAMEATAALSGSLAVATLFTVGFTEAEDALKFRLGWTELDYERDKAARLNVNPETLDAAQIDETTLAAIRAFEQAAVTRGADYTTFRRLAEQTRQPHRWPELRAALVAAHPDRLVGPLWRLVP